MDEELRALERSAAQGDQEARARLERARARAGLEETLDAVRAEVGLALEARERARADFARDGQAELRRFLEALFAAEPGLQLLAVRGYTPGFMDGELCEHIQSALLLDGDDELPELFGGLEAQVDRAAANGYEAQLGEFQRLLHLVHGTGWQLVVRRAEGGVELAVDPYDCGY